VINGRCRGLGTREQYGNSPNTGPSMRPTSLRRAGVRRSREYVSRRSCKQEVLARFPSDLMVWMTALGTRGGLHSHHPHGPRAPTCR